MADWLKHGFKSDINASVRRSEIEATQVQVGTIASQRREGRRRPDQTNDASLTNVVQVARGHELAPPGLAACPPTRSPVALEPTVVLDEHSNYLNHLNQLRRINAGDDLADRPGYGLYLVRIPVTLSPGPRSRRGKGAIITVSAKPVMTKHTLRNALRNTVINETVNNLTHAIRNQSTTDADRMSRTGHGTFSLVSYADTELFYGRPISSCFRQEAERSSPRTSTDEPHHRSARVCGMAPRRVRGILSRSSSKRRRPEVGRARPSVDPLEELGNQVARRDFAGSPGSSHVARQTREVKQASGRRVGGGRPERMRKRRRATRSVSPCKSRPRASAAA